MVWFKVDDGFHASRKVVSIPRRLRFPAIGLWTTAGSWSGAEELDGHVPGYMLDEWGATQELIDALLEAGLWEEAEDGIQFANWAEYQPTREGLEEKREQERLRKAEWRAKKAAKEAARPAGTDAGQPRDAYGTDVLVPSIPSRPDPTRPDPTLSTSGEVESAPPAPLSPFCSKHPHGTEKACRGCGSARMAFEAARVAAKNKPTPIVRREATCPTHPEWPMPCEKCAALAAEVA